MALDLQSLSITQAYNAIVSFFKSQENNTRWKDLTTGSEGAFLIRLLSNVISNISYRLVSARRENYISTASLLSSNIGIAVNLGYSVFRGTNQKRLIRLTPDNDYTLPKFTAIGVFDTDYDIITLEDVALSQGVEKDIKTTIGKVKEFTFTTGTANVQVFSQFVEKISEDYVLLLGSTEVPTTKIIKEMIYDKYLVRTNPYNSVDVLYLNNASGAQYKYNIDTEFTVRYVELADTPLTPYNDSMFSYGQLLNTLTTENFVPFEDVNSIKVTAPIDHEVQNLIRSKADYSNRIKQLVPNVKETSYYPITPTYTLLTYLKDDYTTLKSNEIAPILEILRQENFFGTPLPDITVPRRYVADLEIFLTLKDKFKDIADIKIDISNILKNNFDVLLGQTFNVYTLERILEELSYVEYARVNFKLNTRQPNVVYQLGYILSYEGNNYIASKILSRSGTVEPNWNLPLNYIEEIDTGLETNDSGLIWKAYKKLPFVPNLKPWQAGVQYSVGDYASLQAFPSYMIKVVDLVKYSGTTTPDTSNIQLGDFLIDGSIVWVCKVYNPSYPLRKNITGYRLGDSVNIGSLSFESVSYAGTTLDGDISFELPSYTVVSTPTSSSFVIAGDKTYYFQANDTIKARTAEVEYTYSVLSSTYDESTNRTLITIKQEVPSTVTVLSLSAPQRGTKDGEILWQVIKDINILNYPWNVYNVFSFNLTLGA